MRRSKHAECACRLHLRKMSEAKELPWFVFIHVHENLRHIWEANSEATISIVKAFCSSETPSRRLKINWRYCSRMTAMNKFVEKAPIFTELLLRICVPFSGLHFNEIRARLTRTLSNLLCIEAQKINVLVRAVHGRDKAGPIRKRSASL